MYVAAIFLPLLAAIGVGLFGRRLGDRLSQALTCLGIGLSAVLAVPIFIEVALNGNAVTVPLLSFIASGDLVVDWALKFDTLSAVMVLTVSWVSFLVHVYSIGYMHHDSSIPRFMAYLSLFTFFMFMLVTADNLVQMFFGWEGVGLASYLLIGFWYDRPSASAAAIKAFVVNRVGDFGFSLGIFACFLLFGTINLDQIFAAAPGMADATLHLFGVDWHALTIISLLLFVGAMGKSAQLGLHTWLPDAMEGPTPVSALIHAATMVTAGVFMVARMSPVFEYAPIALGVVVVIGASTAFFAATVGCTQTDIKRVIAYSTCSQLGYMFFALGVGAYQAAIFHLMTHAFFKALLFLSAGSVIHAMSDEQDMRNMGGLWKHIPFTYAMMWIGSLALAGVPVFAGYYSKDMILESAYAAGTGLGTFAFVLGILAAAMTAFYSWRLLFLTFHGQPRANETVMAHVHESPASMTVPLAALAVGAVFAGMVAYNHFVGEEHPAFWGDSIAYNVQGSAVAGEAQGAAAPAAEPEHAAPAVEHEAEASDDGHGAAAEGHDAAGQGVLERAHHVPFLVKILPLLVTAGGIALAWVFYIRSPAYPVALAEKYPGLYRFVLNKWYFDELYDRIFVRPMFRVGRVLWRGGDMAVIDGLGPDGIAAVARDIAARLRRFQSGYVYHYAFLMIIGVVVFVSWRLVEA
ncbi:NADH-quinone oxidoreductase subunit L [Roseospira marina]|uniref:NADH-quinone oxidoreductase subunit L n=1 Tax=Roseospira marina TaxID=140057 RepID=A0A5M6I928_9PROT|nr:NADH-quinone oxidoreductase subunit L [Roseospira marina]KAA5604766.1 NADH-quinone oxidoreductase subunit L [Roseospira marina]MBB4313447.1 NADH-quinone oxidoreductase subunit L [Roseospira marina]MBB5086609.1 NADH-quinone oxidoreductase subunit L [Roseospira marina]